MVFRNEISTASAKKILCRISHKNGKCTDKENNLSAGEKIKKHDTVLNRHSGKSGKKLAT